MKPPLLPPGKTEALTTTDDKIARMRAAANKPERCEFVVVCSDDKQRHATVATFARLDPRQKLKLEELQKLDETGGKSGQGSGPATAATYDIDQMELGGLHCKWCGNGGIIYCHNCDKYYCQAAVTAFKNAKRFNCPGCGINAELQTGLTSLNTSKAPAAASFGGLRLGFGRKDLLPKK